MINRLCGGDETSEDVQAGMLTSCAIGCVPFGLLYGFLALTSTKTFKKYVLGIWSFQSKRKFVLKLVVYALCAVIPILPFFLIEQFVAKDPYLKYFLLVIGIELACFSLAYFVPIFSNKLNILSFSPLSRQELVEDLKSEIESNKIKNNIQ